MIIEEMKMWPEPAPIPVTTYVGNVFIPNNNNLPATTTPPFNQNKGATTQFEINKEWNRAQKAGMKYGNQYCFKGSHYKVKIVGYNLDPATMEMQEGIPCVIKGERAMRVGDKPVVFNYTVEEILEMDQVYE